VRLALACPTCGAAAPPAHKFCAACGTALQPASTAPAAPATAAGEGERRQVTVLFIDLAGYTRLL
jgi:class 3 adenylate cyclase